MATQRTLLGLVLGLAAAAAAQAQGTLHWPGTGHAIGLQAPRLHLNLQAGDDGPSPMERLLAQSARPGLNAKLVGKARLADDLGVYGRLGPVSGRTMLMGAGPAEPGGVSYGVGLRWNITPAASAVLGWDSYDFHGSSDVRATSLGLQWRY
jgi:hypothetical protein